MPNIEFHGSENQLWLEEWLKQRLQEEKEQLSKQSWFKTIETQTDLLKEQTQAQQEIFSK